MEYKYCSRTNFEDLACGRVIYHRPGMPNFPVRLAQEIFERCLSYLQDKSDVCVYDPCCGSGYLLTVLGILNIGRIKRIIGSDISDEAVSIAKCNLSLISENGLSARLNQLNDLYGQFNKASHKDAIESAKKLMALLSSNKYASETYVFRHDILSGDVIDKQFKADIVIADVPYGNLVSWQGTSDNAVNMLLNNLSGFLKPGSVVAICSDKKQRFTSERFKRLEKQNIGKRKFEILRPVDN